MDVAKCFLALKSIPLCRKKDLRWTPIKIGQNVVAKLKSSKLHFFVVLLKYVPNSNFAEWEFLHMCILVAYQIATLSSLFCCPLFCLTTFFLSLDCEENFCGVLY